MLLDGGMAQGRRLLSPNSVALMTTNRLHAGQMQALDPAVDFLRGQGFGLGLSVTMAAVPGHRAPGSFSWRSEEHTSELPSLMRISYAVFCLKKTKKSKI